MDTHEARSDFDAEAARVLLRETEQRTRQLVDVPGDVLFGSWGVAWLVGYLAMWWSTRDQDPYRGPAAWAFAVLGVAMIVAVAVTAVTITRAARGISGDSARTGMFYGLTWAVGFVTWQIIMAALVDNGLDDRAAGIAGGAMPALIVAIIYCASAALWEETSFFVVGVWLALSAAVGVWTGPSTMALVIGVLGSIGFLVGVVLSRRGRA